MVTRRFRPRASWTTVVAAVALLALSARGVGAASPPDPWELAALERYRSERVWLPVAVLQADGAGEARRELRLAPAEEIDLVLPHAADLRLEIRRGAPESLDLCVGDGSGLCAVAELAAVPTPEGRPVLLWQDDAALPTAEPRIVRVGNRGPREVVVEAASGRYEPPSDRFPEPFEIGGSGTERLVEAGDARARRMFEVSPGRSWTATLDGPAIVRVESRLLYPPGERESRQTYRIDVLQDGRTTHALDHLTGRYPWGDLRVDGARRLTGREETSWFLVEEGRRELTLEARRPVLVAVTRGNRFGLAAPVLNGPGIALEDLVTHLAPVSTWDADPAALAGEDVAAAAAAALRLARDNRWQDGGLLAAAGVAALARKQPEADSVSRLARELRGLATFPRELVPEARSGELRVWTRSFEPVERVPPADRGRPGVLDAVSAADLLRDLPEASFHELGVEAGPLVYRPPARAAATELEVLVWEGPATTAEIRVSMEGADERILRRVGRSPGVALPRLSEAARSALARDVGRSSWDPETSAIQPRSARVEVSVARLPLPAGVRRIELGASRGSARVAVRYRASRPFSLSESAYRSAVTRLGGPGAARGLLERILAEAESGEPIPPSEDSAAGDLVSHWRPLVRRLQQAASGFSALVGGPPPGPRGRPNLDEKATRELAANAATLAGEGQWLLAFELWTRAATGRGPAAEEAGRARVEALEQIGEEFLAEALLRAQRIHGGPEEGHGAGERLARVYDRRGDATARRALRSWEALHLRNSGSLARLCEDLLWTGEAETAAALALLLPDDALSAATRISSFLEARWWWSFGEAVTGLPAGESRELWRARGALVRGEGATAFEAARAAGAAGASLANRLGVAESTWRDLRLGSVGVRWRALTDWESWRSREPGPFRWREASDRIVSHAGDGTLLNPADGAVARYHRSTPGRPVVLALQGPVRLAVEVRPVHRSATGSPVDSWLEVRADDGLHLEPILGDRPTVGLQSWISSGEVPGRAWRREIDLGPGRRMVSVRASDIDLLVRVETLEPALPLGGLPTVSPVWMARALERGRGEGGEGDAASPSTPGTPAVCVLGGASAHRGAGRDDATCLAVPALGRDERVLLPIVPVGAAVDEAEAARWELRRGDPPRGGGLEALLSGSTAGVSAEERLLAAGRLGLEAADPRVETVLDEVPETTRSAFLATRDRGTELLDRRPPDSDAGVRGLLDLLSWRVREGRLALDEAVVAGSALAAERPAVPGVQDRLAVLERASGWNRIEVPWSLPGVRRIPALGWQPESPTLRVRKALLPDSGEGSALGAGSTLAALLVNPEPTRVRATVSQLDLPFLSSRPLTVSWRLDGGDERTVSVARGADGESLSWSVPAGRHRLEAWIEDPVANQYARVDLEEGQGEAAVPLVGSVERRYWVATRNEPVILRLYGPAWVRVDEAVAGLPGARSEYRRVAEGWQTLELWPRPGNEEGHFRAFVLEPAPPASGAPPRDNPARELVSMERLQIDLPEDVGPLPESTPAMATPAMAARGTWTAEASAVRRRLLEDRVGESTGPEEFVELAARYRRRRPEGVWFVGGLVGRLRDPGSPTLGAEARIDLPPRGPRPSLGLAGTVYVQDLESGPTEYSATLRGTAGHRFDLSRSTFHRPWAVLFLRELSREGEAPAPAELDQDVFTHYKSDHLRGLTLGESFGVDLAGDLRIDASASVTSNEGLDPRDPDHLSFGVGLSALAGPLRVDLAGQLTRYLADGDRQSDVDRSRLELDLAWERWTADGHRWEVVAGLRHDFDTQDTSGLLGLRWHRGGRRRLLDFAPRDARFDDARVLRSLRRREDLEVVR